jgi:hypothetical protein
VKRDSDSKIITAFNVTDASVHDSQQVVGLIDEKNEYVKLDSEYVGGYRDEILVDLLRNYHFFRSYRCRRLS